jgi:hypothetical protein
MTKGKRDLSDLDLPMGAFQVSPDWYEKYWLKADKAPPPESKTPRWSVAVYAGMAAAAFSLIAVVVGGGR